MNHLFQTICFIVIAALLSACGKSSAGGNTKFFQNHDAQAVLSSIAQKKGINNLFGPGIGRSTGGIGNMVEMYFSFEGDTTDRNFLMSEHKKSVEEELNLSGAEIQGAMISGDVKAFSFQYENSGKGGFIRAIAVLEQDGKTRIYVVMYEHDA